MTSVKRKRILNKSLNKCRRFSKTNNEWCGWLTPTEIFTLIEAGVIPVHRDDNHIEWLKERLKKGLSNPIWFYFYPNIIVMKSP